MALFMDVHTLEGGVSADALAEAHKKDIEIQDRFGVHYRNYWVDEEAGKVFCLAEGPDADSVDRVHREGHGMAADEIYLVTEHA